MTARRGSLEARLLRLEREAHIEPMVVLLRDFAGEIGNPARVHFSFPKLPVEPFVRLPEETPEAFRRRCCDAALEMGQPFITLREENAARLTEVSADGRSIPPPYRLNHPGE